LLLASLDSLVDNSAEQPSSAPAQQAIHKGPAQPTRGTAHPAPPNAVTSSSAKTPAAPGIAAKIGAESIRDAAAKPAAAELKHAVPAEQSNPTKAAAPEKSINESRPIHAGVETPSVPAPSAAPDATRLPYVPARVPQPAIGIIATPALVDQADRRHNDSAAVLGGNIANGSSGPVSPALRLDHAAHAQPVELPSAQEPDPAAVATSPDASPIPHPDNHSADVADIGPRALQHGDLAEASAQPPATAGPAAHTNAPSALPVPAIQHSADLAQSRELPVVRSVEPIADKSSLTSSRKIAPAASLDPGSALRAPATAHAALQNSAVPMPAVANEIGPRMDSSAHAPAALRDPFTALDAESAAPPATWIHAGAHQAEAGYLDPALGWVGVRAEAAGNTLHAAIVPGSPEAAQALGGHLAGLNTYLAEHHGQAANLTMAPPENGQGGSGLDHARQGSEQPPARDGAQSGAESREVSGQSLRGSAGRSAVELEVSSPAIVSGGHISVTA
jgi:hypothetical protein